MIAFDRTLVDFKMLRLGKNKNGCPGINIFQFLDVIDLWDALFACPSTSRPEFALVMVVMSTVFILE